MQVYDGTASDLRPRRADQLNTIKFVGISAGRRLPRDCSQALRLLVTRPPGAVRCLGSAEPTAWLDTQTHMRLYEMRIGVLSPCGAPANFHQSSVFTFQEEPDRASQQRPASTVPSMQMQKLFALRLIMDMLPVPAVQTSARLPRD